MIFVNIHVCWLQSYRISVPVFAHNILLLFSIACQLNYNLCWRRFYDFGNDWAYVYTHVSAHILDFIEIDWFTGLQEKSTETCSVVKQQQFFNFRWWQSTSVLCKVLPQRKIHTGSYTRQVCNSLQNSTKMCCVSSL